MSWSTPFRPGLTAGAFFWWWATLAPRSSRGRALHRWGYPVNISIIIPAAFCVCHLVTDAGAILLECGTSHAMTRLHPPLRDQEGRQVQRCGDDLAALWGSSRV